MTHLIVRLKNEGKRVPNVETEPDFYKMTWLPDPDLPTASISGQLLPHDAVTVGQQGSAINQTSANYLAEMLQNYQAAAAGNPLIQQFQAQSLQAMVDPSQYATFLQGLQAAAANHNVQQLQATSLQGTANPSQGLYPAAANHNAQQFQAPSLHGTVNPSQYAMPSSQGVQTEIAQSTIQQFQAPFFQGPMNQSQYVMPPFAQGNQYSATATNMPPLIHNYQGSTAYTIDSETAQRAIQNVAVQESAATSTSSNPNVGPTQQQNITDFAQSTDSSDLDRKPAAQTPQEASQADSSLTLGIASDHINMPTNRQTELARQSDRLGIQQQSVTLLSDPSDDPMLREFAQSYLQYFNSDSSGNNSGSSDEANATNRDSQQPPR